MKSQVDHCGAGFYEIARITHFLRALSTVTPDLGNCSLQALYCNRLWVEDRPASSGYVSHRPYCTFTAQTEIIEAQKQPNTWTPSLKRAQPSWQRQHARIKTVPTT